MGYYRICLRFGVEAWFLNYVGNSFAFEKRVESLNAAGGDVLTVLVV